MHFEQDGRQGKNRLAFPSGCSRDEAFNQRLGGGCGKRKEIEGRKIMPRIKRLPLLITVFIKSLS